VTLSFWAMAYGTTVLEQGTTPSGAGDPTSIALVGIGLSISFVPIAFVVAGMVSRKPDWYIWVLAAMGLAIAVGLPLMWFRNPLAALLAGFSAGAVVALERPEGTMWHTRAIAAFVVAVIAIMGMQVQLLFFLIAAIGPALPFTAMGIADILAPRFDPASVLQDADAG